jgi:hypothetical protein
MYDFQEHIHIGKDWNENSFIHYYPGVNMNITKVVSLKKNSTFVKKISPLFQLIDVTRLVIEIDPMSINTFTTILNLLPNIHMIRITLLSSPDEFLTYDRNTTKNLCRFLKRNKIINLTLRNITSFEQIYFILDLFPRIQYFAIQSSSDVDLLLIVECTLRKIRENNMHHPMTLCIVVVEGTNDKVEKLKAMIRSEKLIKRYTIYRRRERFYLQWKKLF